MAYRSTKEKVLRALSLGIFVLGATLAVLGYFNYEESTVASEEASALYGGVADLTTHQYAGFILNYTSLINPQTCGIVYLSRTKAVSAAHCFDTDQIYYSGKGILDKNISLNYPITSYKHANNWSPQTLAGDLSVLSVGENSYGEYQGPFAQIGTPEVGCDYEIIAYGRTDKVILDKSDLRRRGDVCIERVSNTQFTFKGRDSGICFGDSGSPIFRKGTNQVVGLVSAISVDGEVDSPCYVSNSVVATNLSAYTGLIYNDQSLPSLSECGEPGITCGESQICRSNQCINPGDLLVTSNVDTTQLGAYLSSGIGGYIVIGVTIMITFLVGKIVFGVRRLTS